jgi:predicted Fe-S protein YdhL (DUF1289 family)
MSAVPPSPCISVCVIDPRTGWCQGCRRTMEEIAGWIGYSPEQKRAVLARLPERRATSAPAAGPPR